MLYIDIPPLKVKHEMCSVDKSNMKMCQLVQMKFRAWDFSASDVTRFRCWNQALVWSIEYKTFDASREQNSRKYSNSAYASLLFLVRFGGRGIYLTKFINFMQNYFNLKLKKEAFMCK